jgi:hypothetical protein
MSLSGDGRLAGLVRQFAPVSRVLLDDMNAPEEPPQSFHVWQMFSLSLFGSIRSYYFVVLNSF